MKKGIIIIGAISFIVCLLLYGKAETEDKVYTNFQELYEDLYAKCYITGYADYMQFEYEDIYEYAHTVALVKSIDDLTQENSYGINSSDDKFYWAHSLREVEVIHYYKNEKNNGKYINIAEQAVMLDDSKVYMEENTYPFIKGNYYLVFLDDSFYENNPYVCVSGDNGKVDLTYLNLNRYKRLALEAVTNLNLREQDKSDFLQIEFKDEWIEGNNKKQNLDISTKYTLPDMSIQVEGIYIEDNRFQIDSERIE